MAKDRGEADAKVTYEDQKKINLFARKNARFVDLKEEIEAKKKELQNLEDASDDLMLLDEDEAGPVPYLIGEVFVNHSMDKTQELIENAKENIQAEIKKLETTSSEIKSVMDDLKVKLYAKFGDQINLEPDDE
uniref:prefoldin subunit 4-like n=1 Tax=Styela clava TaxID=7725 RepID=UPI0019398411|nr:prefoldin subunit 4-like [Styela clava]